MNKETDKIEIELEKLKLIAEYYEFPLATFFMSVDELKKLKNEGGSRTKFIREELEKLEKIRDILRGPKSLEEANEIAEKIYRDMLKSGKFEFEIKKLPKMCVRGAFPGIKEINEIAVYKPRGTPNEQWGTVHYDLLVSYLVAQKMKKKWLIFK